MPKVIVLPAIRREDYDAFKRDIRLNHAETFDEWTRLFTSEVAEARRQGKTVIEVLVKYDEFTRYCRANEKKPSPQSLLDFAISTKPVGEA